MAKFLTGKALDEALTDIIWNAKKELIILSPFIHLDNYCKEIFKKIKNNPTLELIIVFGKNENQTYKSLKATDLDFFKEFPNVVIIYCANLHAKFYANENEALVTSLNLLDKSMTQNIEYGILFNNSPLNLDKLYKETIDYTNEVIKTNPCVFVKRPVFKKVNFGFTTKYQDSKIVYDKTDALYNNEFFKYKYYDDFEYELFENEVKLSREEFSKQVENKETNNKKKKGNCIRCGVSISYDTEKPLCKECYHEWAQWQNIDYIENFCHCCGVKTKTSMAKPECLTCFRN